MWWFWATNEIVAKLEIKLYVSELGNLNIVNFRGWKFGTLQSRLLKVIRVLSVCALFALAPGKRGDGGAGRDVSVPQHARFRTYRL